MSDKLYPAPIDQMLYLILAEEQQGSIFGISKDLFFRPDESQPFRMRRYGQVLETPIGVAAGPHTQLSQNIIAAWLTGARYIELKTVQTLDEIEVAKPCIDIQDEGYNCEWSQELKLRQSFDQYLDAWILVHILHHYWAWEGEQPGVIFNMSAGYDLRGILNANVQEFFGLMENCTNQLQAKLDLLESIYPAVKDIVIPARITDNITLSTMHGCPPDEIEKIARYLITERKLNTAVKLNPTLQGPDRLREIINSKLGFRNVTVPDAAFEHDLKYEQALVLISNLTNAAEEAGVEFSLKLTNTLEVLNQKLIFPESEQQAYLSGRALHPISVNLAAQLQQKFDGLLDLSFCAGADAFNITDLVACGLAPVTTCSDLLKPGGYGRLSQYLENLATGFQQHKAHSIGELIINYSGRHTELRGAILTNLQSYANRVLELDYYRREKPFYPSIKGQRPLGYFDCVAAPCVEACAAHQGIPDYMYHTAHGEFDLAYDVILRTNSMPAVTGYVCDHQCQNKCTRINYDQSLLIREIKRYVTERQQDSMTLPKVMDKEQKVAVIGGGPSGISCAYFLGLAGLKVTLYERQERLGGMVSGMIPEFRLGPHSIADDLVLLQRLGVTVQTNHTIHAVEFERLLNENDYIYLAVGAQASKKLNIPGKDHRQVLDPLQYLTDVKEGKDIPVGADVLVLGGGNTAMDAARTARRAVGESGKVTIVYRRTIDQMPADWEEVAAAQAEGIAVRELIAPVELTEKDDKLILTGQQMKLGKPDDSGRPRPVPVENSQLELKADYVIPAIGQEVELDFLPAGNLKVNFDTGTTDMPKVYAGGDAIRGANTIIGAIGDGHRAARSILRAAGIEPPDSFTLRTGKTVRHEQQVKFGRRDFGPVPGTHFEQMQTAPQRLLLTDELARNEAARCLYCDEFCDVCVTVCPNRANQTYPTAPVDIPVPVVQSDGKIITTGRFKIDQPTQIFNLAEWCNECGNCTTFCPTAGRPFADKPRVFLSAEDFTTDDNCYLLNGNGLQFKAGDQNYHLRPAGAVLQFIGNQVRAEIKPADLKISNIEVLAPGKEISLEPALKMAVLWQGLSKLPWFENLR